MFLTKNNNKKTKYRPEYRPELQRSNGVSKSAYYNPTLAQTTPVTDAVCQIFAERLFACRLLLRDQNSWCKKFSHHSQGSALNDPAGVWNVLQQHFLPVYPLKEADMAPFQHMNLLYTESCLSFEHETNMTEWWRRATVNGAPGFCVLCRRWQLLLLVFWQKKR